MESLTELLGMIPEGVSVISCIVVVVLFLRHEQSSASKEDAAQRAMAQLFAEQLESIANRHAQVEERNAAAIERMGSSHASALRKVAETQEGMRHAIIELVTELRKPAPR